MSIDEIYRLLRALKRRYDEQMKENLFYIHTLAGLITPSISRLFSKEAKFPNLYEAFPDMFKEELEEYKKLEEERQLKMFKERMKQFAIERNNLLNKEKENQKGE